MDESSFDIDPAQLAATSRLFPAHRLVTKPARRASDVSYLLPSSSAEFGEHAWDEGGHA